MIEKLDADKDGKLSAEELEARGKGRGGKDRTAKMLKHFDTDKNGSLSEEEYNAAAEKMQKRKGGKKKHGDKKHGE
jgi:Ca2+-binding EF-hand superfamily protein